MKPTEKRCPKCGEVKSRATDFTTTYYTKKDGTKAPRTASYCKACVNKESKKYRDSERAARYKRAENNAIKRMRKVAPELWEYVYNLELVKEGLRSANQHRPNVHLSVSKRSEARRAG